MKLIAVDLDGTLLNSRNEVSAENLSAISSLADIGVSTAVLTGRTMGEIPPELLAVDLLRNNIGVDEVQPIF